MTLSNQLLQAIPPRSFDLPICKYSYRMKEYFGFTTSFVILTQIHYTSVVLLGNQKEYDGEYYSSRHTSVVNQMELMFNILTLNT